MPDTENYTSAAVIVKMKLPLKATFGRNQERHQPSLPIPTPVSFYHEDEGQSGLWLKERYSSLKLTS